METRDGSGGGGSGGAKAGEAKTAEYIARMTELQEGVSDNIKLVNQVQRLLEVPQPTAESEEEAVVCPGDVLVETFADAISLRCKELKGSNVVLGHIISNLKHNLGGVGGLKIYK